MNNEFGLKELYSVKIKATSNIEIGNHHFLQGENIITFDKIQISNIEEVKKIVTAHGGFEDRDLVWWETSKEVDFQFAQGVVNSLQFSLMSNSKMFTIEKEKPIIVSAREVLESDEEGKIILKDRELIRDVFIYKIDTGERLTYTKVDNNIYQIEQNYIDVIVDYNYTYNNGADKNIIGQIATNRSNDTLWFEGRTKIKDDITGTVKTGILVIPRFKIVSHLLLTLGEKANPVVHKFSARGLPYGDRGNSRVMEIFYLNDDIDADID